ncbi:putative alcohol dehydrogenase [Colletotrichum truncatum]|uniref:Alcohol dehydrogenase n=1 Tax=Colletotrichum truncatum TaxID=5467 RepID=A0ACC3Z1L1_COLTU
MEKIPTVQKAAVLQDPGPNAKVVIRNDVPVPTPGPHEVLVRISTTGICGSETRALRGWGAYDPIVGHEGVGIVVRLGPSAPPDLLGRKVGVKWLYSACGTCSACVRRHHNNCPKQINTGKQRPGTLQQFAVADSRYLTVIPEGLDDAEVAPLLCAGLTMMGAVSKLQGELERGNWVVIQGPRIAARMRGLRVIAVDKGAHEDFCRGLGAEVFVDYLTEDVERVVTEVTGEGAHAVLVVPESEDAYRIAPKLVRAMGTIVCVGLPHNEFLIPVSVTMCAVKALNIKGAMVGTEEEMAELLGEAAKGRVRACVERFGLSHTHEIIQKLSRGEVFGRAVVTSFDA